MGRLIRFPLQALLAPGPLRRTRGSLASKGRPRRGAGALLMIVLIAVLMLAAMGLVQFFAEQVTRSQRSLREANYMRYLGEAALTEATLWVTDYSNTLTDELANPEELLQKIVAQDEIPIPRTKELGSLILGGDDPTIKVYAVLDKAPGTAAEEGVWGDTPEDREVSKVAFKGEDAGLLTLIAEVEVVDPLGGNMSGRMSRGFAYRVVSPLPPTGLDKVTFLGHNWEYLRGRLRGASSELFRMVVAAGGVKATGGQHVEDRFQALNTTANQTRTIGKMTKALLTSFDQVPSDGANMQSILETEIGKACSESSGGGSASCAISDGRGGIREVDAKFLSECMMVSDTLNKYWKNQIRALMVGEEQCVQYLKESWVARQKAEGPNGEPPLDPDATVEDAPDFEPEQCISITSTLLEKGDAAPLQNTTSYSGAQQELRDRLFKMDEGGNPPMDGLTLPGCGRPGFGDNLYDTVFKRMLAAAGSFDPENPTDAEKEHAWKQLIGTTIRNNLKDDLDSLRANGGAAGKQMTLENLMLWSNISTTFFEEQKTAATDALEQVKPTETELGQPLLTYPGMADVKEPLLALLQEIETENANPSGPDPYAPPDPSAPSGNDQGLSQLVRSMVEPKHDKFHGAYLGHPESWAYLQGPVYLTDSVDEERLQYIFNPAPLRTDILKYFPLPPAPLPEPNVDNAYRGFLVTHANWSRPLGDDPGSGGASPAPAAPGDDPDCTDSGSSSDPYKPDYSPEGLDNLVGRLGNTECIAWQMATVLEMPDKFEQSGELSDDVKLLLKGEHPDFPQGPEHQALDLDQMKNEENVKPFENPVNSSTTPDNPYADGQEGKTTDGEAVTEYVAGWNNLVDGFLKTYMDANDKHSQPTPFQAWPIKPPDDALADWAGTVDGETTWGGGYTSESERQTYQEHVGVQSKGQVYVSTVLKPSINRQRSAFRFSGVGEFIRFLVSSCGRVGGTYFIDEQEDPAVLDVAVINSALSEAACEGVGSDVLNLQGFAYMSFPKGLEIKGKITALGADGTPETGRLVLLANGVKMSGGSPEVTGMILSNGHFHVDEGSDATITGTLVTTGTLTQGTQNVEDAVQDAMGAGNTGEVVPLEDAKDLLSQAVGKLQPLNIQKFGGASYDRTKELKLIFSPFRVSQDFEVRRQ